MGVSLSRAGIPFLIVEKAAEVGGTWRENVYPGSGCDIVSHLYSFSFFPKPDWSRRFALQDEILDYLRDCTKKFELGRHIRFNTELSRLRYDEKEQIWEAHTNSGLIRSRFVVSAVGQLNLPFTPDFADRRAYSGSAFHCAQWDRDVDLDGKNVAVVGSGASAIQFVPQIAERVASLKLFQRSPNWVIPKDDRVIPEFEKWAYGLAPVRYLRRLADYWQLERTFAAFLRKSRYGRTWEQLSIEAMHRDVRDEELRRILTPDYPAGCKRILLSNDWYRTLARENVTVIPRGVSAFHRNGVVDAQGEAHDADVVIYATGFRTQEFLAPLEISGVQGRSLADVWAEYPVTHRGIMVPGFPNFFMIYGPNTNLGHGSAIFMHECQINFIRKCIKAVRKRGCASIEPTDKATRRWLSRLQSEMRHTVWAADCSSWYKTEDGRITNNWSSHTIKYWWQTLRPRSSEFIFAPGRNA